VRLPQTGVESPAYYFESLGYMVPDRAMDPYFAEFLPLTKESDSKPHMHPGFEFLYLLEGELDVQHSEHKCRLEAGDALYFDASSAHSYRCTGKKSAMAIIVTMHQAPQLQPLQMRPVSPTSVAGRNPGGGPAMPPLVREPGSL
jgi:mannose-6-phosphate isomerase-like protein (cupin superfamily)